MSGDKNADSGNDQSVWDEIEAFADANDSEIESNEDTDFEHTETTVDATVSEAHEPSEPTESDDSPFDGGADQPAGTPETDAVVDVGQPDAAETSNVNVDDVFDEMDVSQVDGEALWDELAGFGMTAETDSADLEEPAADAAVRSEQTDEPPTAGEPMGQADHDTAAAEPTAAETVVDKRKYCQQCPYFSKPPEVACRHEGTSIVEVLVDGRFRLRGCPVVTDSGPDRTLLNDGS